MRSFRNPRYAPESLERRLSPTAIVPTSPAPAAIVYVMAGNPIPPPPPGTPLPGATPGPNYPPPVPLPTGPSGPALTLVA